MKTLFPAIALAALALLQPSARAQSSPFVAGTVSAYFVTGPSLSTATLTGPTSATLAQGGYVQFGGILNDSFSQSFFYTVHNGGSSYEFDFTIINVSSSAYMVQAGALTFGVTGLFLADAGQQLTDAVDFTFASSGITGVFESHYNAALGQFYFTNTTAFTLAGEGLGESTVQATGNFTTAAVPEPGATAALMAAAALSFVMVRRRKKSSRNA